MKKERARFRILVVDDEPEIVRDLVDLLEEEGYGVAGVASGTEALARLETDEFGLVLTDLRMPPPDGLELTRLIHQRVADLPVIILTAHADPGLARKAIEAGALDYVTKPWNTFELLLRVRRVQERWDLLAQRARLLRWMEHLRGDETGPGLLGDLVARSPAMLQVLQMARQVAASDATVLLRGESGTGKSVLAATIHGLSTRAGQPFLKVNCGAIPEHLLESELFGHEQGAFTGAVRRKPGLLEVADGGSLLLDEIGDMAPSVQVKVLQAIEEKSFLRVGGTKPVQADVRILASTHQDLEEAIGRGDFREDLYYRLNVFPILLPPLRDRKEDIPVLVERFLRLRDLDMGRVSPEAMRLLSGYAFPGNIRELENLLERALILAGDRALGPDHFPALRDSQLDDLQHLPEIPEDGLSLEEVEKRYILAALRKAEGNKSRAAQLLGMTRRTLYSRMERHQIPI